ncbi:WecB/TagA/CpsF family glycosyltransferase [Jannaschia sp. 2305UL9-9]|uniref:WecB/TagA/CpsF family glycosyltransferase n=1 Tax=Jannaschia sp. 2305UL9-9 TaxID=3121638 RepID=UPI0035289EDB
MTSSDPTGGKRDVFLRVTDPDRDAFLKDIGARMAAGTGFSVATINLDHVVNLRRTPTYVAVYEAQTHVVADGNPIVWLSRMAGRKVDLIPGSELIFPLCELAVAADVPVALVGSTDATLARTAAVLEAEYPGLRVACRIAPAFGFDPAGPEAADIARRLDASGAGLCFLALGSPKQERLAANIQDGLPSVGFVSIGAGLDFIAGTQTRAPVWMRKLALEWLWRLAANPRRLAGRYGRCIAIFPGLVFQAIRARY